MPAETQPVEGCYDMIHLPLAAVGKGARPVREEAPGHANNYKIL